MHFRLSFCKGDEFCMGLNFKMAALDIVPTNLPFQRNLRLITEIYTDLHSCNVNY